MAHCLIALGSNLGDRAEQLHRAVRELSRLPASRLLARSGWLETPAAGGPPGQGPFLNGVALLETSLEPARLRKSLEAIETLLGRQRTERWQARAIDLDVLLYDAVELQTAELTIPHPRMAFRRFVLAPAAEVAPWMIHPETGWTVGRLLDHLNRGAELVSVADVDPPRTVWLAGELARRLELPTAGAATTASGRLQVVPWKNTDASPSRPKLIVAASADPGVPARDWRKILNLPGGGPIAWVSGASTEDWLHEATAAVHSVWPELATPSAARVRAANSPRDAQQ